jgi:hypothetical protein
VSIDEECKLIRDLIAQQPVGVQSAIRELQHRGLSFCGHFGYQNAVDRLAEMNRAFAEGRLYEWMRDTLGVISA